MKVVLDTNIILASISPRSKFRLVMDKFERGDYILSVTTDIMLEYEEKLTEIFNSTVAELFVGGLHLKKNVEFTKVFFNWRLIYPDMDDNKFVDCAIPANVHYLVTNDRVTVRSNASNSRKSTCSRWRNLWKSCDNDGKENPFKPPKPSNLTLCARPTSPPPSSPSPRRPVWGPSA